MMRTICAPYRILDCGGWTDTSFMPGGKGACSNVAVSLYVRVSFSPDDSSQLVVHHKVSDKIETIALPFTDSPQTLAEAVAVALRLPQDNGGKVEVESDVPPGSGLGGSASYSVALLVALNPNFLQDRHNLAEVAQLLETKWLNNSCGTQDQTAAAFGGVSYSQIDYPKFTHEAIVPSDEFRDSLEQSLVLVYTGESHFSSDMHHTVVEKLKNGNAEVGEAFDELKKCGDEAAEALKKEDVSEYKSVLNRNWVAQKALHPGITTEAIESLHKLVLSVDQTAAFKGSGAGGGGSVGILVEADKKADLVKKIRSEFPTMMVWDDQSIDTDGAKEVSL